MSGKIIFSCDDGHPLDLKVARIMKHKGLQGIFYVPIVNLSDRREVLKAKEIRKLSREFEIGCHGYSHKDLTRMSPNAAFQDMKKGKEELERILDKRVFSFCPPKGKFNRRILFLAKRLGFEEVRSARTFSLNQKRAFLFHPNLHLYPHTLGKDMRDTLLNLDLASALTRLSLAGVKHLELINYLKKRLSKVHVWFHSWEIEELGLWEIIEKL